MDALLGFEALSIPFKAATRAVLWEFLLQQELNAQNDPTHSVFL